MARLARFISTGWANPLIWILVRLKLRLLRNAFRTSAGLGLVLFTFFAASMSFTATVMARAASTTDLLRFAPLLTAVMILGWTLVPLMFGASDEMVDTTRLASFPLTAKQLTPGMAAAALVGPGPIAAAVPLLAIAARAPTVLAKALGFIATAAVLGLAVGCSRLLLTALGSALRRRRSRDLATVIAGIGAGAVAVTAQLTAQFSRNASLARLDPVARVMSLTPFGWPGDALARLVAGELATPFVEIAGTAALAGLAFMGWIKILDRSLTEVDEGPEIQELQGHLLVGTYDEPGHSLTTRAVLAKELRYMRRHPRYRVQIVSQVVVLIIGGAPFLTAVVDRNPSAVVLGGLPGLTAGVASANMLGTDGRSLWAEWLAMDSMLLLLRGRALAFILIGVSGAILVTLGVAGYTRGWQHIPTGIASGVGFALTGAGVGTYTSTLAPTPFPDENNPNPFASGAIGEGCLNGLFTISGVLMGLALSVPVLLGLAMARSSTRISLVVIILAPVYGALIFWLVSKAAAKRADRKAPDIITSMTS